MYETGEGYPSFVIADENWALCRGYSAILGDVGLLTAVYVNSIDACVCHVEAWPDAEAGLAIVGPNLGEPVMFHLFRWLHDEKPHVKSILISRQAVDPDFCLDVAANHVQACLPINAPCEDIAQAVLDALTGTILFSSDMLEQAFQPIKLNPRERDVLRLMAEDKTYKQIADVLTLSSKTVDKHVQSIFKKLNVHDHDAAVARAHRRKLL